MDNPFGRYVRARRVAAGLSLRDVAGSLGVSHVYLGEVERGVSAPLKRDRWNRLAEVIPGLKVEELEQVHEKSRPVQIPLDYAPPQYQNLALALARRIKAKDLNPGEINTMLSMLGGGRDEEF